MQYATSGVATALLKDVKEGTRNRAGFRNATCSPFEDDEITFLEYRPAVKRERSSSVLSSLSSPLESSAEGNVDDEDNGKKSKRVSKKQRSVKNELISAEGGPGPSSVHRGKRKLRSIAIHCDPNEVRTGVSSGLGSPESQSRPLSSLVSLRSRRSGAYPYVNETAAVAVSGVKTMDMHLFNC